MRVLGFSITTLILIFVAFYLGAKKGAGLLSKVGL